MHSCFVLHILNFLSDVKHSNGTQSAALRISLILKYNITARKGNT